MRGKKKLELENLLVYECPEIAKYVPFSWIQNIVAELLARRVNRKIIRFNKRIKEGFVPTLTKGD